MSIKTVSSSVVLQHLLASKTSSNSALNDSSLPSRATVSAGQTPDYFVKISTAGTQQLSKGASEAGNSLEVYALPKWYAKFVPIEANPNLGVSGDSRFLKGAKFTNEQYGQQLREYDNLLRSHFQKAAASEGITTSQQYYDAEMHDPHIGEKVHQNFLNSISSDGRMQDLMKLFEIA